MTPHRHKSSRIQYGFSLLEALITVAVFSIGLLGVAMTQYTALREQRNAQEFGIANESISYLADRIRISKQLSETDFVANSQSFPTTCATKPDTISTAEAQVQSWRHALCERFGPGNFDSAIATVTDTPGARWALVTWIDRKQRGARPPADPNCPTTDDQYPGLRVLGALQSGQRCVVQMLVP